MKKSHLNGFFKHALSNEKSKKSKVWTKNFTHISDSIVKKFQKEFEYKSWFGSVYSKLFDSLRVSNEKKKSC